MQNMDILQIILLSALSLVSLSFLMKSLIRPKNKKPMAPMVPGAWPFLGHWRLFQNGEPTHVTYSNMADVYGPVFMTKVGSDNIMIVSSQEVAKEIFTVHDKLLNRPVPITACKLMAYNSSFFSFTPERSCWRETRSVLISEILSKAVVDMPCTRAKELDVASRDLYKAWEQKGRPKKGVLVDMKLEFHDLIQNISLTMISGKRYFGRSPNCDAEEARRYGELIREFLDHFTAILFSDSLPCLGWMDWRIKKAMKRTGHELDKMLEGWLEEHKKKRKDSDGGIEKTFLDRLIEIFEHHKISGFDDARTATKATCLNLVLSGPEAATAVLIWAASILVNKPHVLRKAQEELIRVIGKERVVTESDLEDLVYIRAVIMETYRLYPPGTLAGFRTTLEDFDIANGNFHVPAGTQVLVNAWKIYRDPNLWSNPEEFEPERFLTSCREVDFGRQNYKLFPFGLGRKACPAIPLAMRMVQYALARFLHEFDMARPTNEYVNMTGTNGLVNLRATPLEVFITPRLDKSLYHVDHEA